MIRVPSAAFVFAVFVAMPLTAAVAQQVPQFNVEPSCRAAASGSLGMKQDLDACLRSENGSRDTLAQQWAEFAPDDRASCMRLVTLGTPGTYTELLTCLEMKRDVRKLPKEPALGTVGQAPR